MSKKRGDDGSWEAKKSAVMLLSLRLIQLLDTKNGSWRRVLDWYGAICQRAIQQSDLKVARICFEFEEDILLQRQGCLNKADQRAHYILGFQMAIMEDNTDLAEAFDSKLDFETEAGERLWQHKEVIDYCKLLASYAQNYCNSESFSIASRLVLLASQKLQFTGQNQLESLELQQTLIALDARCHLELKDFTQAESSIRFLKTLNPRIADPYLIELDLIRQTSNDIPRQELVLRSLVDNVEVNGADNAIVSAILSYSEFNHKLASELLNRLIREQCFLNQACCENLLIARFWLTKSYSRFEDHHQILSLLDYVYQTIESKLSKECSSRFISMNWEISVLSQTNGEAKDTIRWLELCLHDAIQLNEKDDQSIRQHIIQQYSDLENWDMVRAYFETLNEENKSNPSVQLAFYKCCLSCAKFDECSSLIHCIKTSSSENKSKALRECILLCCNQEFWTLANDVFEVLIKCSQDNAAEECMGIILGASQEFVDCLLNASDNNYSGIMEPRLDVAKNVLYHVCAYAQSYRGDNRRFKDSLREMGSRAYDIGQESLDGGHLARSISCSEMAMKFLRMARDPSSICLQDELLYARSSLLNLLVSLKVPIDEAADGNYEAVGTRARAWREQILDTLEGTEVQTRDNEVWWDFCYLSFAFELDALMIQNKGFEVLKQVIDDAEKVLIPEKLVELHKVVANSAIKRQINASVRASFISCIYWRYVTQSHVVGLETLAKWIRCLFSSLPEDEESERAKAADALLDALEKGEPQT